MKSIGSVMYNSMSLVITFSWFIKIYFKMQPISTVNVLSIGKCRNRMKKKIINLFILISLVMGFVLSCEEDNSLNDGYGILRISIFDDPFPIDLIDSANVTITKVQIRRMDDRDVNPFITLLEDTLEFNLIELRNGITAKLVEEEVPVGMYDLLRLYVSESSIVVKDCGTYDMKMPSVAETGIKLTIEHGIMVEGGTTSDLLLDFNLEKSFVLKGNINTPAGIRGFSFKPVIRAVNNSWAGTVQGIVSDKASEALKDASVWIEAADTVLATAYSDATGFYALPGIPIGTYPIFATKEKYDTITSNIEVKAANLMIQDFILTPNEE